MPMTQIEPWVRAAIYLLVIGLALEAAHRIYWTLRKRAKELKAGIVWQSFLMAAAASLPLLTAFSVTWAFCLWVDRQSLADIGLRTDLKPGFHLTAGLLVAIAVVALVFAVGRLSGWFRVERFNLGSDRRMGLPTLCGGVSDYITASVFEEIVMRGYVFSLLYRTLGVSTAIVGSAAIFSGCHLVKHSRLPVLYMVNAFFFGVLMAQSRFVTGALWMPIGLHAGWNLASLALGMPFAGRMCETGLITCSVEGPEYVTGGYCSPDAGLLGTLGLLVAASTLVALAPVI